MAPKDIFDEIPEWIRTFTVGYAEIDAAFLYIDASDPELLKGVDPDIMSRESKANSIALKPYYDLMMSNKIAWCIASLPTEAWAKKVYPELSVELAMDKLQEAIFSSTRADMDNPVKAWESHQAQLDTKLSILNETQFVSLKYKNQLGTDVTVGLPKEHIWFGGADIHYGKGYKFVANIPTEEVYTMPETNSVNGRIVSSYPLRHNGVLIKDFWFEFKDGKVIDYGASENIETLTTLLDTDEGAKHLGEVALVPYDSPISNQNILFYNTLFDENASCHFALGRAYPICIKDGENMNENELKEKGANTSLTHVDFMVGTEDLEIIGITLDGIEVEIFKNGNFVI
jgi:aminopeptidase